MNRLKAALIVFACLSAPLPALAANPDYSGSYDCKGDDAHEGAYDGIVTLKQVPEQASGKYSAYSFKLEVPGFGAYPGHASAHGANMAIFFANTDPSTKDFGTGIAAFTKNAAGKWIFTKYYYEPEYKGGNHGTETCTQR